MSAEAMARLRKYVDGTATLGDSRSRVDDLRALLDAYAALEAAHTEALDALEKLRAAQKHVLEVTCAGDDEYMAAVDGAEAVLAKAGRR
jgi:hypothetical protein